MPASDVTIILTLEDIPVATIYNINIASVVGGTATITTDPATEAEEDEIVTITISDIEAGKQFASLVVNDQDDNNITLTTITLGVEYSFQMPASDVTIILTLEDTQPAIVIDEQPQSQSICQGDATTITVDAYTNTSETLTYQWYFNEEEIASEISNSIIVSEAGEYYCLLSAGSETLATDIATITIIVPNPELDALVLICEGEETTLNPGEFTYYLWSNESTEASITINSANTYSVTVTDSNGCTATAETEVQIADSPEEFSFQNQSVCFGLTVALEGPVADEYEYLWNTGETTYSINVTNNGTYTLTVTNTAGCSRTSSATLSFENMVIFDLTEEYDSDTIMTCNNVPNVKLGPLTIGETFLWSDGSNKRSLKVTQTNWYSVTVTDANGCVGIDSAYVQFNPMPEIELGNNVSFCSGNSLELTVQEDNCTYEWNTGENTQSITITTTGTYACTVTTEYGCVTTDSMSLTIYMNPNVNLGEDFEMYENQTVILTTQFGHATYEWSLGDEYNEHFALINAKDLQLGANTVSVTVTTINGCEDSDSVVITVLEGVNVNTQNAEMFHVFPNPTTGMIHVNGENIQNIRLFDSLGRMVLSTKNNVFDISSYADGNYTLIISTDDNNYKTKIIKQ